MAHMTAEMLAEAAPIRYVVEVEVGAGRIADIEWAIRKEGGRVLSVQKRTEQRARRAVGEELQAGDCQHCGMIGGH